MENEFLIKNFDENYIEKEFYNIGFDENYLKAAKDKYNSFCIKIFDLTVVQATILKQTALSCGTDCAVNRGVLTHEVEKTDAVIFATTSQLKQIIKKLYIQPFKLKILAKNLEDFINKKLTTITIRNKTFTWDKTYIMGILNITPNSFSDGGEFFEPQKAFEHFSDILSQGADIIDIGAESTAPNNIPVTAEEEIERLKNILPQCREKQENAIISIDTRNSQSAKFAIENGADIINDISGFSYDEKIIEVVKNTNAFYVLTFCEPIKNNTVDETIKGLTAKINKLADFAIDENKIILDVGIGFNKTFEQNIELIKRADEICSLGLPVLYGISRKSVIQKLVNCDAKETLSANISLGAYLAQKGVNILRVHDVAEHKTALQALDRIIYD